MHGILSFFNNFYGIRAEYILHNNSMGVYMSHRKQGCRSLLDFIKIFTFIAFLLVAAFFCRGSGAEGVFIGEESLTVIDSVIVVEVGGSVQYLPHVRLGKGYVTFEVDESRLDLSKVGDYTVYAAAIDAQGRRGDRIPVTVRVTEGFDEEWLDKTLDALVTELDIEEKSAERVCRDIYRLVREKLFYSCEAQSKDIRRAAFYALQRGSGDCYSYFALTKLLLDRCGIENLLVERERGFTSDTHYWNMVNIGEGEDERWYHLDTTELCYGEYSHSGCLLTDRQIEAYSLVRENFYRYDKSAYPEVSSEIITPTKNLDGLLP